MAHYSLVVSALLALGALQQELQTKDVQLDSREWVSFKSDFGKSYESSDVEAMRKLIFFANKLKVEKFNRQEGRPFTMGINHLSDLTEQEYNKLNGFRLDEASLRNVKQEQSTFGDNLGPVPDEVDWRKVPGRVSEIKNQGNCGSCWAFSATGALEGQELTHNKSKLVSLSEQNLLDCAESEGCNGGNMYYAFEYAENGIESEGDYPYEARKISCRYKKGKSVFKDDGSILMRSGEDILKQAVARYGPISVAIHASDIFMNYQSGVFVEEDCDTGLNHGVLIVGYGTDKESKLDYWIVKNSWGKRWGDEGYIKMARNHGNMCGISNFVIRPKFG